MLAVALGLGSSVVWGTADFLGGLFTRRLTLSGVVIASQFAGLAALVVALILLGGHATPRSLGIGAAAGLCGAVGIASFYAALAAGKMSIVSPVSACGALVPMVLALATGERPGTLALAGAVVALAGAVLASMHEYAGEQPGSRLAIVLAGVAALGIGGFLFLIAHAAAGGQTLPALLGARMGSLTILVMGAVIRSQPVSVPRSAFPAVAGVGLLDSGANGLFAVATQHGYLSIVSVLGSVYPIVTVILAQVLLRERLTSIQVVGVAAAVLGVAMVSAA
ncbi:MAG: EamA family transporter [Gaiellales bacterium]